MLRATKKGEHWKKISLNIKSKAGFKRILCHQIAGEHAHELEHQNPSDERC